MTYSIIHNDKVAVEGCVEPSMVQRALKYWKDFGMTGNYTAVEEPRLPKTEITLARKTNSK